MYLEKRMCTNTEGIVNVIERGADNLATAGADAAGVASGPSVGAPTVAAMMKSAACTFVNRPRPPSLPNMAHSARRSCTLRAVSSEKRISRALRSLSAASWAVGQRSQCTTLNHLSSKPRNTTLNAFERPSYFMLAGRPLRSARVGKAVAGGSAAATSSASSSGPCRGGGNGGLGAPVFFTHARATSNVTAVSTTWTELPMHT